MLGYLRIYVRTLSIMTDNILAKKLLTRQELKSTMLYGVDRNSVTVYDCPACEENHINVQVLCDVKGHFYIRCPNSGLKIVGVYA